MTAQHIHTKSYTEQAAHHRPAARPAVERVLHAAAISPAGASRSCARALGGRHHAC